MAGLIVNPVVFVAAESSPMEFTVEDRLELHSISFRLVVNVEDMPYQYPTMN